MPEFDKFDTIKSRVLDMLKITRGIVSSACEAANISRQTFYNYCNEDPAFKECVDDINEASIDFVESKLHEKISGIQVQSVQGEVYDVPPSDTAIIFYLKTKGKKRGYVERTEQVAISEQPLFGEQE